MLMRIAESPDHELVMTHELMVCLYTYLSCTFLVFRYHLPPRRGLTGTRAHGVQLPTRVHMGVLPPHARAA